MNKYQKSWRDYNNTVSPKNQIKKQKYYRFIRLLTINKQRLTKVELRKDRSKCRSTVTKLP